MGTTKKFWTGIEDLHEESKHVERSQNEFESDLSVSEFLGNEKTSKYASNRRDFLKFLGFGLGAATLAACEAPVIKSIPYINKPEDITPGVANWYASSYFDGNDYANVLVKTREGRPIHIKGNHLSPVTGGAINARINASVMSLYNEARLTGPMVDNSPASWSTVDAKVKEALSSGKKVRLLTNTIVSPSTRAAIAKFAAAAGSDYDMGAMPMSAPAAAPAPVADAVDADPMVSDAAGNTGNDALGMVATPTGGGDFKHVVYDPISYSGMREANEASFGKSVLPSYDFEKADVIVSIGADFLSTWLMSSSYMKGYGKRRKPENMSKHFQFETVLTVTGANADERMPIAPSEEGQVAAAILAGLGGSVSAPNNLTAACKAKVDLAIEKLSEAKGKSIVVAGSNDKGVQVVVNKINAMLNNYGSTLDIDNPVHVKMGNDAAMAALLDETDIGLLIIDGVNPMYSYPESGKVKTFIDSATVSVSTSMYEDETAALCNIIAPTHHQLESWDDHMAVQNYVSISQPTISPLHDTRQMQESMLVWGSAGMSYLDLMKQTWTGDMFSKQSKHMDPTTFWNYAVHDGGFDFGKMPATSWSHNDGALSEAGSRITALAGLAGEKEIVFYQKTGAVDGSLANNPLLQELPDPISKVTWDNYITMNPHDMKGEDGGWFSGTKYNIIIDEARPADMATITIGDKNMTLPVYPSPGQKRGTVGVALGYGRGSNPEKIGGAAFQYEEYGELMKDENDNPVAVGQNAFPMVANVGGNWMYAAVGKVEKAEGTYPIAATQSHHTMMGRDSIVREATLTEVEGPDKEIYNPTLTLPVHEGHDVVDKHVEEVDLWDAHPVERVGHHWGMNIDLSTCIGCGSCVTACNSENNIPVVGKDEVRRSRDMHWIRMDRYYSSDEEDNYFTSKYRDPNEDFSYKELEKPEANPRVTFVPMMCQHCNHAPCETVCPVAATTHSNEGLNQMTYNRCIGTRYCANNCPFKVRRFNWFNYINYDKFAGFNPSQGALSRMVLNPDVVVRARGVIEKCSLCVQQIQAGKLAAKKDNRPVRDGEIQTACAASCPTNAITFGDYNDEKSFVAEQREDRRAYQMLEEVGVHANMTYMVKVRNSDRSKYHDPVSTDGGATASTEAATE